MKTDTRNYGITRREFESVKETLWAYKTNTYRNNSQTVIIRDRMRQLLSARKNEPDKSTRYEMGRVINLMGRELGGAI